MSYSASISGHVDNKEQEAGVVETLRAAVKECGASYANISTSHHGQVDLLAPLAADNPKE
jgi:hypothetical protein